ncbi:MAG: hypothetical protein ABI550_06050 [Ignavibacteriaceae bacterium]
MINFSLSFRKNIYAFSVLSILIILNFGCKEDNISVNTKLSNAKIEGKVLGKSGFSSVNVSPEKGANVFLSKINDDGSIQKLSNPAVVTDANGKFIIEIFPNVNDKFLLTAQKGNEEWNAVVSSEVRNGLTFYSQPINDETTIEFLIYKEALKNNYYNISYSDISIFTDESIAYEVINKKLTVVQIAAAINVFKSIEVSTLSNEKFNPFPININEINKSKDLAQSLLERDLFFSVSQKNYDEAFNSFYESILSSYINSGLQADTFYKVLEIAYRRLLNNISNLDESIKYSLEKRVCQIGAYALNYSVQSKFSLLNPSLNQFQKIVKAGDQLQLNLRSAKSHSDCIDAFSEYHQRVVEVINDFIGIRSEMINALDKNILDLKLNLINSLNANIDDEILVNEYLNFFNGVKEKINELIGNENNNEIIISAEILLLLNIQF